jgi:hypothetical protein
VTTYFRSAFVFAETNRVSGFNLRLLRDDGAVVYLNGTEVFRSNLPTNAAIYFNTLASLPAPAGDGRTNYYPAVLNPALLARGTNVVAVEIHQSATNSPALSFDLALTAETWPQPVTLDASVQTSQLQVTWPGWAENLALWSTTNLVAGSWQPVTNQAIGTNALNWVSIKPAETQRFFRLQGL